MNALISLHDFVFSRLGKLAPVLIPTLARLVFAGTLLIYYWHSAGLKVGDGIFGIFRPSDGAYIQMFPKVVEAAGYDFSQIGIIYWFIALAGTWAEYILPALIVLGLFTRLASIGMIGFIFVQTWVDINGHGLAAEDIGAWFDRFSGSLIIDQRSYWIFLLIVLVLRGAGPLSLDYILTRRRRAEEA